MHDAVLTNVFGRGVPVVVLRNLNLSEKLANGTVLVYHGLSEGRRLAICKSFDGRTHLIPRIGFYADHAHLKLRRRQFPLRLAFAMTVHKSQGQTLGRVGIDLCHPFFAYGQLGVAVSRAQRSADVLCLCNARNLADDGTPCSIRNPVSARMVSTVRAWEHRQQRTRREAC